MNADELNSLKLAVEKIKTINTVFEKIDQVVSLISAFTTDETKQALVQSVIDNIDDIKAVMATSENIDTIATDLIKGNYLGNRKIDIDLSLNKSTSDATVSYSKATIILTNGTQLAMPFLSGESVLELTSHNDIRNYIISHTLWANVQYTECTVEEATSTTNTLIRFRDADGHSSNIERVELAVYSGTALDAKPSYFWANSTSALQTIANRVGDIIALGNDIDKIVELSQNIDELTELQNALSSLIDIHTNLTELLKSSTYAQTASTKAGEASASALSASNSAQTASDKATLASQKADIATQKANEIKAITVQATTLTAGSNASASYNTADGKFTFGIPQGAKGDRGEAFKVSAIGLYETRTNYDTQPKDFSFFATDTSKIYFKNSDTSADWSAGVPFGKGDKGDKGDTGNGISSLSFVSSNLGVVAGIAGATDTYRITMTSGSTFDFNVYNGNEPDVTKSYVDNKLALKVSKDSDTGVAFLPSGTTAQRPTLTASQKAIRYNTTLSQFETWSGTAWASLSGKIEDTLGSAIASDATITIGTAGLGDYSHITGVGPITSLGTAATAGIRRTFIFDSAGCVLTHSSNIICPGAVSITSVVGTVVEVIAETTDIWRVVSITHPNISHDELGYLDGVTSNIQAQLAAKSRRGNSALVASTSGTAIDFTGIPSWAKRIKIFFDQVSISGNSNILVRLGTSGIVTTGYLDTSTFSTNGAYLTVGSYTTGFPIALNVAAANTITGSMELENITGNKWGCTAISNVINGTYTQTISNGDISLSGVLDSIRVTNANGIDTFDSGSIYVSWEG